MVSKEQANAFRKHRNADDKQGNLAWAMRFASKALRVSPEAAAREIEEEFELSEPEKVLWRLLRLARRYTDLEHAGLMPADEVRSILRGFVAADIVDMVEAGESKALLPAEIKRIQANLAGKEWRPAVGGLQARVYRPDISGEGDPVGTDDVAEGSGAVARPQEGSGAPLQGRSGPAGSRPPEGSGAVARPPAPSTASTPPAPSGRALTPAEKKTKEQLAAVVASLSTSSHYVFLAVPQTSDDATIRNAYVQLAREYHPDRLSGTALADDPEARGYVDVLFKRLGDANKTLGSAESRQRYDRELAALHKQGSQSSANERPRRPVEARNAYMMAESFFKKKDYKQAEMHYRQAVMFDPEEALITTALAWCIYLNPDHPEAHRLDDARRRLEDIIKKHKSAEAAYKLGRVLKDIGDEDGAARRFQEALRYQPEHVDAQRELRLAQGRKQKVPATAPPKQSEKAGLLGKLFGKK